MLYAAALIVGTMLVMLGLYLSRYRAHPAERWSAPAAWLRAGMYFCFCILVGMASGALAATLENPWPGEAQLADPVWWLATGVVTVFMLGAYWGYWYRNTLRFGRPLALVPQGIYGITWGATSGLFMLSLWHLALAIGPEWPRWATWGLAYGLISVWQGLFMDQFWDVWVSPEHDTPEITRRKVPRTHIPNMTLCLTHFAVYQDYGLFIAWQTIALTAASYGMRMPPPWSRRETLPARQVPGLFGLPRAGRYIGDDARAVGTTTGNTL